MRKLARILIALAACVALQVAVPVSADEAPAAQSGGNGSVEIGCAARWYRTADGIEQQILC